MDLQASNSPNRKSDSIFFRLSNRSSVNPNERFSGINSSTSSFNEDLNLISKVFLSYSPIKLIRIPSFSIQDFVILSETEILLLIYKETSVLTMQNTKNEMIKQEIFVTEDCLTTLIVDNSLKLVLTGGGSYETKIFIYKSQNLEPVAVLDSKKTIKSFSALENSFVISINSDNSVYKWNLTELGRFSIISNENYDFVSVCEKTGGIVLATKYGKILFVNELKIQIKEPFKIKKVKISYSGKYIAVNSFKHLIIYEIENNTFIKNKEKVFEFEIKDFCFNCLDLIIIALNNGTMVL